MGRAGSYCGAMRLDEIIHTEPVREMGDLAALKASIRAVGLIQPLVVDRRKRLICGRRRYQCLKELGVEVVAVRVMDPKDDADWFRISWDENHCRKPQTPEEDLRCARMQAALEGGATLEEVFAAEQTTEGKEEGT